MTSKHKQENWEKDLKKKWRFYAGAGRLSLTAERFFIRFISNILKAKDKEFIEILNGLEMEENEKKTKLEKDKEYSVLELFGVIIEEAKKVGRIKLAKELNNKIKQIKKKYE